jgi:hypothetical protein
MEFRGRAIYDAPPADKPPMTFRELKWDVYNCRNTSTIDEQRIRQFAQALRGPS